MVVASLASQTDAWPSGPNWGGFAYFSGVLLMTALPRSQLSGLLPPPLSLLGGEPDEEHPLILVFGEMSGGGAHWNHFDISTGVRYREVAVLLPFVRHPAWNGPVVFPHRMYADDVRPVLLGNSCYGLRKELARIDWSGAHYQVHRGDRRCFRATGAIAGPWSGFFPHTRVGLLSLQKIFEQPIVGCRSTGDFVRLYFDLAFERAEVCGFVGDVELRLPETNAILKFRAERLAAHAVRRLSWRTSAPSVLSSR